MVHRRHGSVATYALWALIAVGDLALVVVNAGITLLIVLVGLAAAGLLTFGPALARRAHGRAPATVAVPLKRDA